MIVATIHLPLPVTVAVALMRAIDDALPGSRIVTTDEPNRPVIEWDGELSHALEEDVPA